MNEDEFLDTLDQMERFGGSFVKSLAKCLAAADYKNREILLHSFPEIILRYKNFSKL